MSALCLDFMIYFALVVASDAVGLKGSFCIKEAAVALIAVW